MLSPLAKSNWSHKWGRYTKRQNFSKLSRFTKSNWGMTAASLQ